MRQQRGASGARQSPIAAIRRMPRAAATCGSGSGTCCCCSCCLCPRRCALPVLLDAVWESSRSRWIPLLLLVWVLHRTYVDAALSSALGWPGSCIAAFATVFPGEVTLADASPGASWAGLVASLVSVPLALASTSRFQCHWWSVPGAVVFLANVALQLALDVQYCGRLAVRDARSAEPLSLLLPVGVWLPVVVPVAYHSLLFGVLVVVAVLLVRMSVRHSVCRAARLRRRRRGGSEAAWKAFEVSDDAAARDAVAPGAGARDVIVDSDAAEVEAERGIATPAIGFREVADRDSVAASVGGGSVDGGSSASAVVVRNPLASAAAASPSPVGKGRSHHSHVKAS